MAFTYTKLSSSLTESSVWWEPNEVRLVWITMLVMADKNGFVEASIPGLAGRARISKKNTEEAIKRFLAPDPYSRTPDHEGRRIEVVPRGWRLLNYRLYREARDEEDRREYFRNYRAEERAGKKPEGLKAEAQRVMAELNLTNARLSGIIQIAIDSSAQTQGNSKDEIASRMIKAYQDYLSLGRKGLLRYTWQPAKFFSEGHWANDGSWPMDKERMAELRRGSY